MKLFYFSDTDTALMEFSDDDVYETREVSENLYIDLDKKGNLVSMTIEHAKRDTKSWEFSYQEMPGHEMV